MNVLFYFQKKKKQRSFDGVETCFESYIQNMNDKLTDKN